MANDKITIFGDSFVLSVDGVIKLVKCVIPYAVFFVLLDLNSCVEVSHDVVYVVPAVFMS